MLKDDLSVIFASRLQEALDNNLMSAEDFGEDFILTPCMIKKYLDPSDSTLPMLYTAARIAEYLDVSLDWLCGMDDNDFNGMREPKERKCDIAPWLL